MKTFRNGAALAVAVLAASASLVGAGSASAAGPTYSITIGSSNKCWTPYGGGYKNNLDFVVFDCSAGNTAQQKFWVDDYSRLRYDGKCVLPYGGSPNDGADIVMYDCGSTVLPSQIWYQDPATGGLRTWQDKCVIPSGGSLANNTELTQWTCPGSVGAAKLSER